MNEARSRPRTSGGSATDVVAPTTDDRIDLDVVRDHDQGVVCFHTAGIKKLASSFVNFGFVGGEAVKKKTAV